MPSHGNLFHIAEVTRTESGAVYAVYVSMELMNYLNPDGYPICPTCGRVIEPIESTARVRDCMTHLTCFRIARDRANAGLDPCEPTQG